MVKFDGEKGKGGGGRNLQGKRGRSGARIGDLSYSVLKAGKKKKEKRGTWKGEGGGRIRSLASVYVIEDEVWAREEGGGKENEGRGEGGMLK